MLTQANTWNMNLGPFVNLRGTQIIAFLLYVEITAPSQRPGLSRCPGDQGQVFSIQRTRLVVLSCQDIPRRTIRHEGVETGAQRKDSSRQRVLSLGMRTLRGPRRAELRQNSVRCSV